jgi:sugar phosphate isomerase/epimerase
MKGKLDRRSFVKTASAATAGLGAMHLAVPHVWAAPLAKGAPSAEKLGWRLGCQAYSFNRFSFFEAVDKNASLGLKYIEAYPGQVLYKGSSARMGRELTADQRKEVKKKLEDSGVKLVNFGVGGCGRADFEFAKDMGIETLVSEPDFKLLDEVDKLVEEYGINVALHNHPKPSRYWNPDTVLEQCKGRNKRIGACADTGHWMRSGLVPLECVKKLEGRIISFHFKDLNQMGGGHDVPWGTGKGDVKAVLAEVYRQGLKAVFSIEYEHNWENSLPEIAQCVEFFEQVAAELLAKKKA